MTFLSADETVRSRQEKLLGEWGATIGRRGEQPDQETKLELEKAVKGLPRWLPSVLEYLPDDPATRDVVKELYDAAPAERWFDERWREKVHGWLMVRSRCFRSDLVAAAQSAHDDEDGRGPGFRDATAAKR